MLLEHRNYALKNGFLLAGILCFLTLCIYFINQKILFETTIHSILFILFFLFFPIIKIIMKFDIATTFKEFFSITFLMLAFASLIYAIFTFVFYNMLNYNLVSIYGLLPSVFLELQLDSNNEYFIHSFSCQSQFNSYIFWLIPCTLYAALISLLMNKIK